MPNFDHIDITPAGGIIRIYKLVISGRCLMDEFYQEIEDGNFDTQLDRLNTYIERWSRREKMPVGSWKPLIRNGSDPYKDFEFRTNNLRLYFFNRESVGNIIVLGGLNDKKLKKQNINRMREIKYRYFGLTR